MIRVDAVDVDVASLDPAPAQAVRAGQDSAVVQEYLGLIIERKSWPFPPLEVVETDDGKRLVWDGGHRLAAAQLAAYSVVPVILTRGTAEDALAKARQANVAHGLKRTNADKKKVAEGLVREELERVAAGAKPRSTHELGRLVGLSHAYIGQVRDRLVAESQAVTAAVQEVRPVKAPPPPKAETPQPAPTSAPSRDMMLERVRVLLDVMLRAYGENARTVLEQRSVLLGPDMKRQVLILDVLPRLEEMPDAELREYLAYTEQVVEFWTSHNKPPEPAPPSVADDYKRRADEDAQVAPQTAYTPGQWTQERHVSAPPEGELQRLGKGLYASKRGGTTEERLAPYADQFGLVDDAEIAGLAGVSVGDVQAARQAKGSAPAVAVPAPPIRPWPEIFQESLIARVEALGTPPEALSVVLSSGWRLTLTPPEEDGAWVPDPKRWHDKTFVQAVTPLQGVRNLTGLAEELHGVWSHNRRAGGALVGQTATAKRSDTHVIKRLQNPAMNPDDGRVGWPLVKLVRQIRTAETAKDRKAFENDLGIWALGAWPVADETLLYELPVETMITVEGRERSVSFWLKQAPQMAGGARMQLMAEATRLHKAWRADWASGRGAWSDIDWLAGMPVSALKAALSPAMQGPEFITALGVAVGLTWDAWSAATQRRLIHRICQHRRPIGAALPSLSAQASPA